MFSPLNKTCNKYSMRSFINLVEKWFALNHNPQVEIFENPTRRELQQIIRMDRHDMVRAWLTPTTLYAFPGGSALHFDVADTIGVDRTNDARIFLDLTGPYLPRDTYRAELLAIPKVDRDANPRITASDRQMTDRLESLTTDHPALLRLYGRYEMQFR